MTNNNPDNNQISNSFEQKYNPLKDASFWVAFVLGGGLIIVLLIISAAKGNIDSSILFQPPVFLNLIFLICWEGWIILKKGKKGSLLVGFVLALIVTIIAFIITLKTLSIKREDELENKFQKALNTPTQELEQKFQSDLKKELQLSSQADSDNDGLTDSEEKDTYKTNPSVSDTDRDELTDYEDIFVYKTDPLKSDTDGDNYIDAQEVKNGYNPNGDGKLEPLKTAKDSLIYLEHAFAKGDLAIYQEGTFYSDNFKDLIRDEFNTDLVGYQLSFKNKVFLPSFKDGVGRINVYNEQEIDDQHIILDYKTYEVGNGESKISNSDRAYMLNINNKWMLDIETELKNIKNSNSEKWLQIKDTYSKKQI